MAVAQAALLVVVAAEAGASPKVVVGGAGLLRLEKRTPLPLSATSAVGRIEVGVRLGPRTGARLRAETFRADGLNLLGALVVDVDATAHLGLSGFAGLSVGARSGPGNHFGLGGFARRFVTPSVALRGDAFVSMAQRNDFRGVGLGLVAGLEWRP